jgi:FolB domain-containing protein
MKKATLQITDLFLRAIIGNNEWERNTPQDVIITITLDYDAAQAAASDSIDDAIDYKKLKRTIIDEVEKSRFKLLESLTNRVLRIVMDDPRTICAAVRVEKPGALRFARTVSVEMSDQKPS